MTITPDELHDTATDAAWTRGRVGLWLIGARGSVATTAAVGVQALAARIAPPTGCATAGPGFTGVPLPGFDQIVIGGHDVSTMPIARRAGSPRNRVQPPNQGRSSLILHFCGNTPT